MNGSFLYKVAEGSAVTSWGHDLAVGRTRLLFGFFFCLFVLVVYCLDRIMLLHNFIPFQCIILLMLLKRSVNVSSVFCCA